MAQAAHVHHAHFGMRDRPFAHGPGERTYSANASMTDAIRRLQQVLTARDAVALLTGGPGVGKSTLAECAAAAVREHVRIARVDLRYGDGNDLPAAVLLSVGEAATALPQLEALQRLRGYMGRAAADGYRLALLLDIGNVSAEVARQLLRLLNLAGESGCQLNIILMGPHPLQQQVDVPAMIHLRQRIAFRYRARPLTLTETERYLRHQVEAAGGDPSTLITSAMTAAIYCYVAGVPRLINTLMDAALGETFLQDLERPDGGIIKRTADGLGWKPMAPAVSAEPVQRATAPRAAPPRPVPAAVASSSAAAVAQHKAEPPPSEITLQLRADAVVNAAAPAPAATLAAEARSPTAALFGGKPEPQAPVPMDEDDTSSTGMLKLQDLDDRFAESVFGKDAAAG
jgi:type II secretory pathway predicted ATPase ExeA